MRILASADIHGILSVYEWLVEQTAQHQADLLLLGGDIFSGDWEDGQRQQIPLIEAILRCSPAPVLYIMGNDDETELAVADEHIQPLHGRAVERGGLRFVGYQYTPPFAGVRFVKEERDIALDLKSAEGMLTASTVFLTHAPARGALDEVWGEHVGSESIGALLEARPVLAHIHGHIHERFGRDGNHFNVASAGKRRAMLIELPSLEHQILQARP